MTTETEKGGRGFPWRIAAWGTAALLLLLPLAAMQFTDEVAWTGFDFIFAAAMIGGVGLLFEMTVRMARNNAYRSAVGFALAAAFMIVWATGAVGMIGDEDNVYNLLFIGVIGLALAGAILARFRPPGMALAMAVAAAAHAAISLFGMSTDMRGGIVSLVFAAPWLISAALFRNAAREQAGDGVTG